MKTSELLTFLSRELNCSALSEFLDFKDGWRELMKLLRQAELLVSWTPSEQAKPVIADLVSLFRKQVRGTTKMRMTIHVFSSISSSETFLNMSSPSYEALSSTEYVLWSEYFGYGPNLDHSWK